MRAFGFVLACVGLVASSMASAQVEAPSPRDVIVALYRQAVVDNKKEQPSPFFEAGERRRFFTPSFDSLITEAEGKATKAGDAMLDFDPISDSQDAELKDVKVTTDHVDGDRASVSASFTNYGHGSVVTYHLVEEDHAWKVDDIEGSADAMRWSVRNLLEGQK